MFVNLVFLWLSILNGHATGSLNIKLNRPLHQGKILVYIYNDALGFPTQPEDAYRTIVIKCSHTKQLKIDRLPFGMYAIILIHDQNANGKLDRNWLGLPAEPYALTGHPKFRFGPPLFDDVQFEFKQNGQILFLDLK